MKFQTQNSKFKLNSKEKNRLKLIALSGSCLRHGAWGFWPRASKNGFTLLETLVAIAVMFAALTGPVTLVMNSFVSFKFAKNKLIAAYLAEEGLELIRAVRENNKICQALGESRWDWGSSGTSPPLLKNGLSWRVDATKINYVSCDGVTIEYPNLINPCILTDRNHRLKVNPNGFYGYSGTDSIFTRCVNVTQPTEDEILPTGNIIPREDILDVISTVQWQEFGRTKTFELRERLYNWE